MPQYSEQMKRQRQQVKMGLALQFADAPLRAKKGTFIFDMKDAETGEQLAYFEKDNIITLDAGIAGAAHFKGDMTGGLKMLAIGTGATGNLLSPDAPQNTQRKLNNEIQRKAFSSTTYRTAEGVAVSYRTHIVDFTTTYGEAEAVGALNEMGLLVPASINPATLNPINNGPSNYDASIDVAGLDLMVNYLTFSVISKPATAVLAITWRLTF
jgi:hypothetical protein